MDMRQVEYFLTLTETQNFAHAANRLFISRQGLSKSITMLEKELGFRLFDRTATGLLLTESGRIFGEHARRISEEYRAAVGDMRRAACSKGEHIDFIVPQGFWTNVDMDMVLNFFELHPEVHHTVIHLSDNTLVEEFLDSDCIFAITTDPRRSSRLNYTHLFDNYRCIVVRKDHPLAKLGRIHTRDLKEYTLAASDSGAFDYNWLYNRCVSAGFTPELLPVTDTISLHQYAHSSRTPTLQVGNLSGTSFHEADKVSLFWAEDELKESVIPVNVITRKDKQLPAIAEQLIEYMKAYCERTLAANKTYPFRR